MKRRLPDYAYNVTSIIGFGIALFALAAILILYGLSLIEGETNPYLGIFMLVVFPAFFVLGVLLIPIGMRRARRREGEPPVLDLRLPQHRRLLLVSMTGACLFLLLSTVGLFETYHFSESNAFCGLVCHEPMIPEYTAWADSPHAGAHCVDCHVGPGMDWFLKAKLNGARQLYHFARGSYSRPIPTPVHMLRPASDICEQCHWADQHYPARLKVYDHYFGDEENTHWQIGLVLEVGGTSASKGGEATGVHWHNDPANRMTFVTSDESRSEVEQVVWHRPGGDVVYSRGEPLTEAQIEEARTEHRFREMDCTDCHNRPAHQYESPMETVNRALAQGRLDASVPFLKREAVRVLSQEYETREEAHAAIEGGLQEAYADGSLPPGTADVIRSIYDRHMFPHMKVRWDAYPSHEGHLFSAGCFRCHGSDLRNAAGEGISGDCRTCHKIVAQGAVDPESPAGSFDWTSVDHARIEGLDFRHPLDVDGAETQMSCHECHIGDETVYQTAPPSS